MLCHLRILFFFFNDTATTEIYTLSLHDALPISNYGNLEICGVSSVLLNPGYYRSEEHTSELQSPCNLVCRLLLEKKKKKYQKISYTTSRSVSTSYQHARTRTVRPPALRSVVLAVAKLPSSVFSLFFFF